ncbi:MAG: response regulator, partial [Elusimicrobiaceae bacterium]|nr:response regulator [Elusimicrobiaceae bacterium]
LMVEDQPAIIELLRMVLMREGYEVYTCQSGRDAIATIKEVMPHLIILDVMLPGLDGASIVRIMHEDETLSSIPVIVSSALLESEKMFTPYPQVRGFCSKPMVLKNFLIQVKQVLGEN